MSSATQPTGFGLAVVGFSLHTASCAASTNHATSNTFAAFTHNSCTKELITLLPVDPMMHRFTLFLGHLGSKTRYRGGKATPGYGVGWGGIDFGDWL